MCKEICSTITIIANKLEKKFEVLSVILVPALIKLLPVTIKVIADSAHQTIISFLKYANTSIPLFIEGTNNNHQIIRSRCAEYLNFILKNNNSIDFQIYNVEISLSIKNSLSDSFGQTRSFARKSFVCFKNLFPELAEKLFDELDSSIQSQVCFFK